MRRLLKELYNINNIVTPDIIQYKIKVHNYKNLYDIDFSFMEPYSQKEYLINFKFTDQYPFRKPNIRLLIDKDDIIINSNIYPDGRFCLRLLEIWSPGNTIIKVITSLCAIMIEPDNRYSCNSIVFT